MTTDHDAPTPPERFDDLEDEKFRELYEMLRDENLWRPCFRAILEIAAADLAMIERLREEAQDVDLVIERDGLKQVHPLYTELRKWRDSFGDTLSRMGLTPAARSEIPSNGVPDPDAPDWETPDL